MLRREFIAAFLMAQDRIGDAHKLIRKFTDSGEVESAALYVRRAGFGQVRGFGRANGDSVFLLASITKPMTACAVMVLRDRGMLALSDPVRKFIPEFKGGDRDAVTLKHLLTHTSGLPDMLPENEALRKRHAPLRDFVAGTCKTPLLFKPGSETRYQSMGILLAAEVVERVTGKPLRDVLTKELFAPLGMSSASLGLAGRKVSSLVHSQVPTVTDWDWNSDYWRDMGAPWGGAHANARDVAKLLEYFLSPDERVMTISTAREMITNQNAGLNAPWGIGWMLKPGGFGKHCSVDTFGHWGSTGTVAWADPKTQTVCVLLTSKPSADSRGGLLGPVSDLVSESTAKNA
jgi:CubicO group peptidase (beta-lactamase class C family)